jgi:hypothetical protein
VFETSYEMYTDHNNSGAVPQKPKDSQKKQYWP